MHELGAACPRCRAGCSPSLADRPVIRRIRTRRQHLCGATRPQDSTAGWPRVWLTLLLAAVAMACCNLAPGKSSKFCHPASSGGARSLRAMWQRWPACNGQQGGRHIAGGAGAGRRRMRHFGADGADDCQIEVACGSVGLHARMRDVRRFRSGTRNQRRLHLLRTAIPRVTIRPTIVRHSGADEC